MGDEKELDLSLFEQLDEALEERATGSDRRKKMLVLMMPLAKIVAKVIAA